MYHMVSDACDCLMTRYALAPGKFRKQMKYLKEEGYNPVSLNMLGNAFSSCSLPLNPVLITFDDGYRDNFQNALPILKEYGFSAAVFVVSGFVGKAGQWESGIACPEMQLMGWQELREMQTSGIDIGSHSVTHPHLTRMSAREARQEIERSRKVLEDTLSVPIEYFAYPYGDKNPAVMGLVEDAGYRAAFSCDSGFNAGDKNRYELRRIEITGFDSLINFSIKLKFGTNDGKLSVPVGYYAREVLRRLLRRT